MTAPEFVTDDPGCPFPEEPRRFQTYLCKCRRMWLFDFDFFGYEGEGTILRWRLAREPGMRYKRHNSDVHVPDHLPEDLQY